MERKEFLKKSIQLGLASGGLMLAGERHPLAQTEEKESPKESKDMNQKFKEGWITSLMKNMDEQLDEETRVNLMEACGRACARRWAIRLAESCKGDVKKLLDTLAKHLGKENSYIEGNIIHLGYNKCLCHLVAEGPERLSNTYCNCSRGWALEMFETASGRPVKVELLRSIKRGHPSCQFLIVLL